jgi:hypothetical protein
MPSPDSMAATAARPQWAGGASLPSAFTEGYFAGRACAGSAGNLYAMGLPTDHEAQANLWDSGYRLGRLSRDPDLRLSAGPVPPIGAG